MLKSKEVGRRRRAGGDSGRRCELSWRTRGQVVVTCSTARARVPPRSPDVWSGSSGSHGRMALVLGASGSADLWTDRTAGFRNSGPRQRQSVPHDPSMHMDPVRPGVGDHARHQPALPAASPERAGVT
jgi:hypothetical protein